MLINPNIDYKNQDAVIDILDKIDDLIKNELGLKKSFVAKKVGENNSTYSKFISAVDGYVSEDRIRKYCKFINDYALQNT